MATDEAVLIPLSISIATHGAEKPIGPYLTKTRTEVPSHATGPE